MHPPEGTRTRPRAPFTRDNHHQQRRRAPPDVPTVRLVQVTLHSVQCAMHLRALCLPPVAPAPA